MATTKTKPKPGRKVAVTTASKGKAAAKGKGKGKAASASKSAAKPKSPTKVLEIGDFAKFHGYSNPEAMEEDEKEFEPGELIYIVEVSDEGDKGILYGAVKAENVAAWHAGENPSGGEVGSGEITELKGTALEKAQERFAPITVLDPLAEMLSRHDDSAIEVAVELNQRINETYFWLGGALAKIIQEGSYLKENGGEYEGESALEDFCRAEFDFGASKGLKLARVYRTFSAIDGFDPSKLDTVGWSKANMVERFVTPDNVDEVLEIAETTTQSNLPAVLKERFVSESGSTPAGRQANRGSNKIAMTTMNFRLAEDSAETVRLALQAAMKQGGLQDESEALERICTEWANDHVEAKTVRQKIESKASKARKAREAAKGDDKSSEKPKPAPKGRGRSKKTEAAAA